MASINTGKYLTDNSEYKRKEISHEKASNSKSYTLLSDVNQILVSS